MRRYVRKSEQDKLDVSRLMKRPTRTSVRVLRDMFALLDSLPVTYTEVARIAGSHFVTIHRWKSGVHSPRLTEIEAVLDAAGYELKIVKKEDL